MGVLARLRSFLGWGAERRPVALPGRRQRRAEARSRHRATDEPLWTAADRFPNPGPRTVQDVTPGTPGSAGNERIVDG